MFLPKIQNFEHFDLYDSTVFVTIAMPIPDVHMT